MVSLMLAGKIIGPEVTATPEALRRGALGAPCRARAPAATRSSCPDVVGMVALGRRATAFDSTAIAFLV
jgi:hypothetical protein